MTAKRLTAAAAVLGLSVAAGAMAAPPGSTPQEDGRSIFHGKGACYACHGPDGAGTPVGPALSDGEWLNFEGRPTLAQLEELVEKGVPEPVRFPAPMMPRGGVPLDDAEVAAVAKYVLELSGG